MQDGEVLLQAPVDALLVEREELELLRLYGEDACGGEGGVELDIGAKRARVFVEAEGEKVVFDRADSIETPAVGGDALGELDLHGSFGREVFHESGRESVVGGAIFLGHGRDLAGEPVTESV